MKKKKIIRTIELTDELWAYWEKWLQEKELLQHDLTLGEWAKDVTEKTFGKDSMDSYQIIDGLNIFLYEKDIFLSKPDRSTMKWLHGEHAMLYDVYGCKLHETIVKTYDDERYDPYATVFCPACNVDRMYQIGKMRLNYEMLSSEEFKSHLRMAKWQRKWNRKQNFKYRINKIQAKIERNIRKTFSKETLWDILVWIDNNINHKIVEPIIAIIPGSIGYRIWNKTCQKFCNWVIIKLGDKYNG